MTTPNLAQAAATAAQATREQAIREAWAAFHHDFWQAHKAMAEYPEIVRHVHVSACRPFLTACLAHLDEIERHLPDTPRNRMNAEVSIGPDVAVQR
jgi:hypothetical protein